MYKKLSQRATSNRRPQSRSPGFTIGQLARAAEVGVETIRYYQRRDLLPIPHGNGGVRRYPLALLDRIRFIRRSQNLGFTLDEIHELMQLEDGGNRSAIRRLAAARLSSIHDKIAALRSMEGVLRQLLHRCERTNTAAPCPIIAALSVQELTS